MEGARSISPYGLRMPEELKNWIKEQAKKNARTMNSEIVFQLKKLKQQSDCQV